MITKTILLNSIKKVKDFVNVISSFEHPVDIVSGRYVINAKSIMGIFSIDITQPLTLNIHVDTPEEFDVDISEFEVTESEPEEGETTESDTEETTEPEADPEEG